MKDSCEAGLCPEELLICGKGEDGAACSLKEQVVELVGVGKHQGIEFGRQGKYHMEIRQWESIGSLPVHPLLLQGPLADWTMPVSAGMEMRFGMTAVVASPDEASHGRGTA